MAQQQQQQGQGDDQEFFKLIVFTFIGVIALIAFIATQEERVNAIIGAVSWMHVAPFAYLAKFIPALMDIPLVGEWLFIRAAGAHAYLIDGGYAHMDGEARTFILVASGRCATMIYGGFFLYTALRGQDFRVDQKYRTRHSLESMIRVQSDIWLTSRLARHINPLKVKEISARRLAQGVAAKLEKPVDISSDAIPRGYVAVSPGTWNRALRPEEWLVANGLTFSSDRFKQINGGGDAIVKESDFEFHEKWIDLDIESISEIFASQLRQPWQGTAKLRPSHRAAYAVMAMFYDYDINGGNALLGDLGVLADVTQGQRGKLDAALMAEKGLMPRIDKVCMGPAGRRLALTAQNNAWVESAFPTMLAFARKDRGVLPPAAFLWLKAEDRLMWYILNNVGNEAVCVEAAGALAHARAEMQIGHKIRRPAVYQASRALLEDYLDMTADRIAARATKEIRSRSPGAQLALMRNSIVGNENKGSSK